MAIIGGIPHFQTYPCPQCARLQPGSAQWDLHRSLTAIEFLIRFSSIGRSFVPLEPQGEARTGPLANKWLLGGYNYDIIQHDILDIFYVFYVFYVLYTIIFYLFYTLYIYTLYILYIIYIYTHSTYSYILYVHMFYISS